ncbi:MAG: isoamylase early set domain-containing protein [Proteobacteria bacterium]|nr:isoamylase early set domain-containing protein [Pseudomonadota bacterium]MBU1641102.1 isoamylase early set domain-containing protein [Pseudomonadota bacterium]
MACKDNKKCAPTKKDTPKKSVSSTEFILQAPEAKEVFLVGDFNGWNPTKDSMRKFKDGTCTKKLKLKPGRYEYQFVVDGKWWTDPSNPERVSTEFGSQNSVIFIGDKTCHN